jgi:hypothetical protein
MGKSAYARLWAIDHADNLQTDRLLANIRIAYKYRTISRQDAIDTLHNAGCCVPEIMEALAA